MRSAFKKSLIFLFALLWLTGQSFAAIAFVNAADMGNNGGGASPFTSAAYAVATTGDTILLGIVGDVVPGGDDISSVTWGGVALTLVAKNTASDNRLSYVYILQNATAGSHTFVVTYGAAHFIIIGVAEYSGSVLIGGVDNSTTAVSAQGANTLTTNLTSQADNCWMILFGSGDTTTAPAAGAGSTRRAIDGTFGLWAWFDSNGPIHPAGSDSMTFTQTTAHRLSSIMQSLAPIVVTTHTLTTTGAGH